MPKVETVKVKNGDGFMLINKSDFEEGKHALYQEVQKKAPTKKKVVKKKSVKKAG